MPIFRVTMTSVLDEILKYGKRRRAEFFPEGIPGLNPLSKTETHHDLDSMAVSDSLSPSRNGAFRRRGNGRANVTSAGISERSGIEVPANYPIVKVPEGRVSKRSRLIQKIVHEGKANQDLQAKEKEMRTALESLREENLLLKMEINKFDCEMNGLSSELNQ